MPSPTSHVIKKNVLESTRFEAIDPSTLPTAKRIPRSRVDLPMTLSDDGDSLRLQRRLRSNQTTYAVEPVQIVTRNMPPACLPRGASAQKPAEPTPEELEALARQKLEREIIRARDEAFEAGRMAAQVEMQEQLDESLRAFAESLTAIQTSWDDHLRQSEPHLVQLAFRIARAVLDAPLLDDVRRITEAHVADAVDRMAIGVPIEIILHPISYQRIKESGLDEQLSATHNRLRWRTNPDMKPNEWIVQSSRSTTRRLEIELLDQLQRNLSLRDLSRPDQDSSEQDGIPD
ncbi:MAG: FliH/SctL family protein [Rhodothermales bacterium]